MEELSIAGEKSWNGKRLGVYFIFVCLPELVVTHLLPPFILSRLKDPYISCIVFFDSHETCVHFLFGLFWGAAVSAYPR